MSADQPGGPPPPHDIVIQMGTGFWVSKLVYAAAKLQLADHLADGPKSAEELAGPTGAHAPSLYRLMRTLSSLEIFVEDGEGKFGLTPLGEALKRHAPGSAWATVLSLGSPWMSKACDEIMYTLETGKTGFEKAHGMPVFDFFAKHPEQASLFSETMVGIHGSEPPAVAEAYDFSGFGTVVDVGGATGNMLAAILNRHSGPQGVLFDLPHVVTDAPALLSQRGVQGRVSIQSGSFFESVPEGGDAYVLSHVIHDWTEEQCLTILGNVRRAMKPDSRLLIVEMVLPGANVPHPGKILDMVMMIAPGGQERTEAEYSELLAKAGFRMERVVPTQSPVSVVEAVLA